MDPVLIKALLGMLAIVVILIAGRLVRSSVRATDLECAVVAAIRPNGSSWFEILERLSPATVSLSDLFACLRRLEGQGRIRAILETETEETPNGYLNHIAVRYERTVPIIDRKAKNR